MSTSAPSPADGYRNRLLAFVAAILGIAALRASYPVAMPMAFALIVIAAVWPLKPWLDSRLPSWLSYLLTVVALLLTLALFAGAVYFSAAEAVRALTANWTVLEGAYDSVVAWADRRGIPLSATGSRRAWGVVQALVSDAYTFVFYLGFVGILVALGLPEVGAARRKLKDELEAPVRRELMERVELIAEKVRRYLGVTLLTSLLTGLCSLLWSLAMGLELALTWGVLNFLLNFIPVVGNIVGIIPPTLYALIQFGDASTALVIFLGFAAIQLVISNFIYPLLQGRSLSLSPVAIVVALAFWSWIWGLGGALIAVPLTAAAAIICDGFDRTRWVAKLLSRRFEG